MEAKLTPNLSLLTLITQVIKNSTTENLLFVYLKPVPDIFLEKEVFWYRGKGSRGKAQLIWESLQIKQWCACGTDEMMQELFDQIIAEKQLKIGKIIVELNVMNFQLFAYENQPSKGRSETIADHLKSTVNTFAPHEFLQKENLDYLSGYKTGSELIKPLYPFGFLEQNFIYDQLKANTWGVKTYRRPYLTYRGVNSSSIKNSGSTEIVGFYQKPQNQTDIIDAAVLNENKQTIGKNCIDPANGLFKITLQEPTMKGSVEILLNNNSLFQSDFVLLQDINMDVQIASTTFKDAYGRSFMITEKSKARKSNLPAFTWQRLAYADNLEADKRLTDLFRAVFSFLGPKILIADPYFMGNFPVDEGSRSISLKPDQTAMINALLHSAIETGIDQLNILGYWGRASNQADNDPEKRLQKIDYYFEIYDRYLKGFISLNRVQKYLPTGSINFYNAQQEFHNRYWFSMKSSEHGDLLDKVVIITNSLGNINEVDLMPVENDEQRRQINGRYSELFKQSKIKLSI
jgi:hypothetical protein